MHVHDERAGVPSHVHTQATLRMKMDYKNENFNMFDLIAYRIKFKVGALRSPLSRVLLRVQREGMCCSVCRGRAYAAPCAEGGHVLLVVQREGMCCSVCGGRACTAPSAEGRHVLLVVQREGMCLPIFSCPIPHPPR